MAIWDQGVTAVNGADKKWKRGRGEDEADTTLGNWFIFTQRIYQHFCKYISNCQ